MSNEQDPMVLCEGDSFEILKLKDLLEEHNISVMTNADLHGGFDPNFIAQILVYPKDETKAAQIVNDFIKKNNTTDETEKTDAPDEKPEPIQNQTAVPKPYILHPLQFVFYYFLSFGLINIYWFYKNWDYIRFKDKFRYGIHPLLATIFLSLFNFPLFRSVFKAGGRNKSHHFPLAIALPLAIVALWAFNLILPVQLMLLHIFTGIFLPMLIRVISNPLLLLPQVLINILTSLLYLPIIFILRDIEKDSKREAVITIPEIIFILPGLVLWIIIFIALIK